ncbi:MAG: quinohemoprotein amine dehydrogenase subunit alpha [Vicinamibacterales bacterium]|nr:quinohemoprotein amine dehydrogenase subunit alpha [Vicinamibacterales bacterium]
MPQFRVTRFTPSLTSMFALLLTAAVPSFVAAQPPAADDATGIPIASDTVRQTCGSCHRPDEAGRLSRISFRRTTPEGWQQTIRRMVTLNGVDIDADTAREVVRYLANTLGLAPEEARPAAYEAERRADDQPYDDAEIQQICTQCHSMGRVISQRRTEEEWTLLMAMHRGYYPFADFQAFRRSGPPGDEPQPVDQAIAHLSDRFPLHTPEWAAWSATRRPARIAGVWVVRGHAHGIGPVYGQMTIAAVPGTDDQFTTETSYVYARDGRQVERQGRAIVYTGFQWRGRSLEGPDDTDGLREVMMVERDWQTMSGRWFTGAYDEVGLDVTLERVTASPVVTGVQPASLAAGQTATLQIRGANLAASAGAPNVDLGPGISVLRVVATAADRVDVEVRVDADAAVGRRDLFLEQAALAGAVTVYDEVHRIAVTPEAGMARVGGIRFPKQYQQFEARAFHDGPDGESETDDDLDLGIVDVSWSLEEYAATFGDDDLQHVGALDAQGRFTPAVDGPNVERSGNRNNVGDVWVVATYPATPDGANDTLRARAHLLVTVPLYLRWDPTAVERP